MNKILYIIVALVAASVGAILYHQWQKLPMPEHALYYQQAREIKPFEFIDQQGNSFSKDQLKDKWSIVFFGYTSCPDVCPTTLQSLNFIYDDLKKAANNTQILLVTVDPARDSQEKLAKYIAYFNKEFLALRADHGVLFPFARNMGLMYAITDGKKGEYLVDHSASIVLVNPQGKIAAIFKPEQVVGKIPTVDMEKLLSDFEKIVTLN